MKYQYDPSIPRIPFSAINGRHSFQPKDKDPRGYHVVVAPSDHYIVIVGVPAFTPAAAFPYSNLLFRRPVVHEFKHYLPGGGKKWTARCGVDLAFAFRAEDIKLIEAEGMSYVPVQIGQTQVLLNVSGGTANGWTDWVRVTNHTGITKSSAFPKALAAHAMPPSQVTGFDPSAVMPLDEYSRGTFTRLFYKHLLLPLLRPGNTVFTLDGSDYTYECRMETRRGKASQFLICRSDRRWKVAINDVDWERSARQLGHSEVPDLTPWINGMVRPAHAARVPRATPVPPTEEPSGDNRQPATHQSHVPNLHF